MTSGESKNEYWYRVEVLNGDKTYCFFGCSSFDEEGFIRRLSELEYILLEDLVYFDEDQEAKSWTEWDPNFRPRAYLNPRYVEPVQKISSCCYTKAEEEKEGWV